MNLKLSQKINSYFFYGWIIVFVSAVAIFFSSPGQTYSIATYIDHYIEDFHFSRTLISSIYSVATILSGCLLIFMGKAIDKFGKRKMMILVGILLSITCFYNSYISNIVMMAISFFLLRYLGQGSMTLIPNVLIPQWFDKKRAIAISLINLGGMTANLFIPKINVWLIDTYSWQITWRLWSIVMLVCFVPLAYLFIVDQPEDINTLPDNAKKEDDHNMKQTLSKMISSSWTLKEALRTKAFWLVGIISMIVPMVSTGLMFHFFSIMKLKGLGQSETASIIGLIAIPGFIMPFVSGLIIDRFRSKHIMTVTLLLMTGTMYYFMNVHSTTSAIVFLLAYGLITNIQSVTISVIWPRYFGRQYLGSIRGVATIFMVIGSALGPLPFGLSYDLTGGYTHVFIAMMIITSISMILAMSIQKPKKSDS